MAMQFFVGSSSLLGLLAICCVAIVYFVSNNIFFFPCRASK